MGSIFTDGSGAFGGGGGIGVTGPDGVLLYSDLIDYLMYNAQGGAIDPEQRDYRTAIIQAVKEVSLSREWKYYSTHGRIDVVAPVSTGTVTSSGAVVTLSGSTWPTWADHGRLQVGDVVYPVRSVSSNTVLTLEDAPITAFAADEYTLYQSVYALPNDFAGMFTPINELSMYFGEYMQPQAWLRAERTSNYSGPARSWSLMADPRQPGRWAIVLRPYPAEAATVDFIYYRHHGRLRLTGKEGTSRAGTLALTSGSSTATGTGSSFAANMVGSFLRVGDATYHPDGDGGLHPFTEQYLITGYTNATTVTIYPAAITTVSGVKYIVSDPVDAWVGMHNAVLRCCEKWLATARGKGQEQAISNYRDALNLAFEADAMLKTPRVAGGRPMETPFYAYPRQAL